jgi:hypothetical protein
MALKPLDQNQVESPASELLVVESTNREASQSKPVNSEVPTSKSPKAKPVQSKIENKNWKLLLTTTAILAFTTLAFVASRMIFQQKSEIFKAPDKIPSLAAAQIDRTIGSGVRLDEKVTLKYLRSKLSVAQFQSQERKYTVLRIIAPETCGKLGCLYIVKPEEGMSILLQLEDIGVGKEMFKASPKFHCFTVIQRQNGEDRNFEICEQGY